MKRGSLNINSILGACGTLFVLGTSFQNCAGFHSSSSISLKGSARPGLLVTPSKELLQPGESITFSIANGVPPFTYSILSGGGSFEGNMYTAPDSSGEVVIMVVDSSGNTATVSITVADAPPAQLVLQNKWADWPTVSATPINRHSHRAVWTGSKMIVWGGYYGPTYGSNDGYSFDSASKTWTALATTGAPTARRNHSAVWTGSKMIVWGGVSQGGSFNDGGAFDPNTNSWSSITAPGSISSRYFHSAVWTGSRMIVWGGVDVTGSSNTGFSYDPMAGSWTSISSSGAPGRRHAHSAVWTGSKMIVWGGIIATAPVLDYSNEGAIYDPATDSWAPIATVGAPSARGAHSAVWTGSKMIVWGGMTQNGFQNNGAAYDPVSNTWEAIPAVAGAASARAFHTAIWTGSEMWIWGGWAKVGQLEPGAIFY